MAKLELWDSMKMHPSLFAGLLCSTALAALAQAPQHETPDDTLPKNEVRSLEVSTEETATVSAAYVLQQVEAMDIREPHLRETRDYLIKLLREGCNPTSVNEWLDAVEDDAILVGMPGDLVRIRYGEPHFRKASIFRDEPAELWSIEHKPGRMETVAIAKGRVVRILK